MEQESLLESAVKTLSRSRHERGCRHRHSSDHQRPRGRPAQQRVGVLKMNETVGPLVAAGNVAEVFEWGSRVVKLYRPARAKQAAFREAANHAAVELLGLPVPAVWSVQQIGARSGIVFDRVSGGSFAERMREDPTVVPEYLEILVRLQARIHTYQAPQLGSLSCGWGRTSRRRSISTTREGTSC